MSIGIGKKANDYSRRVEQIDASKAVWMAIAFSLAMRIREDHEDLAAEECFEEWKILHENGIVPQKPRRTS